MDLGRSQIVNPTSPTIPTNDQGLQPPQVPVNVPVNPNPSPPTTVDTTKAAEDTTKANTPVESPVDKAPVDTPTNTNTTDSTNSTTTNPTSDAVDPAPAIKTEQDEGFWTPLNTAYVVVPSSIALIVIAFIIRRETKKPKNILPVNNRTGSPSPPL